MLFRSFSSTGSPTATFTPAGGSGDYVLRWTISNAPCATTTSEMTVSVSDAPTIPLIAPGSAAICLGGSVDLTATSSGQATFSGGGVNIQFTGALPYPSTISVSGLPTSGVTVRSIQLNGVTHATPDDIDMLLRSLAGTNVVLMSDVGGTNAISNNN